jgi:glucosamine--fructose-6-phosphate aminotransferase (isomerizing)
MCGIYGFIGKPNKKTRKMLRALALCNEDRGRDSAGIAVIYPDKFYLYKKDVKASKFWDIKTPSKVIGIGNDSQSCIIIGHTRLATSGKINDENAHPYRIANYIFAHNGMISNDAELNYEYGTDYPVDSQIIGQALVVEGVNKAFTVLEGSFAVPFVDLNKPNELNIARHTSPVSLGYASDGVYFTSELVHLVEASREAGINLQIGTLADDKLYTITCDGEVANISRSDIKCKPNYTAWYNKKWDERRYFD